MWGPHSSTPRARPHVTRVQPLLLWQAQIVLERNKLTPKALKLFLATGNPLTLRRIEVRLSRPGTACTQQQRGL